MRRPHEVTSCSVGAAVDALLGIDDQDPLELVDAVDRADVDARLVFDVDAGLGDDVGHCVGPYLGDQLIDELLGPLDSADFATT